MTKRGPKRNDLKLRLLFNLLAFGDAGHGRYSAPEAIEFSGLNQRTAYNYVNQLVKEKALRKVGVSPAVYEPTPAGMKYKSEVNQNSALKLFKPPYAGGRATASHARADKAPPSPSQNEGMARADDVSASREQMDADDEAPSGPVAGPEAPAQPQPAQAGQAGTGATDGPRDEDVRPAPPVPLDHPARVHHRVVKVNIVQPARCRPVPDLIQWGPMVQDSHGRDWYRPAQVLFDDIGVVTIHEFPLRCLRFWLPDYIAQDRARLAGCVDDAVHQAQRIVNWLQRNYGYELGLPEFQDTEVAFPLPDIGGSFQGYIKIKADDGTTIVIDQSKGWAELEILIRASHKSENLRKLLAWANAPTLLTVIQGQVLELQARLPHEIRAGAGAAVQAAIPKIAEAVKASLIPEVISSIQLAIQSPEFQNALKVQVRKATEETMTYQPPAGPDDNAGYG